MPLARTMPPLQSRRSRQSNRHWSTLPCRTAGLIERTQARYGIFVVVCRPADAAGPATLGSRRLTVSQHVPAPICGLFPKRGKSIQSRVSRPALSRRCPMRAGTPRPRLFIFVPHSFPCVHGKLANPARRCGAALGRQTSWLKTRRNESLKCHLLPCVDFNIRHYR